MKKCSVCKLLKIDLDFYRTKNSKDGLQERCKACWKFFPSQASHICSARARKHEMKLLGLTIDQYDELFCQQSGKCKICQKPQIMEKRRLSVDHDHSSGKIRGLLCDNCNKALGLFRDDKIILQSAITYLT